MSKRRTSLLPSELDSRQPKKSVRRLSHDAYRTAWICPLEVEQVAALEMLDEEHGALPQSSRDTNCYNLGSINNHHIVITGLPTTGNCSAATVIAQMKITFPRLEHCLLVGIGGGVPTKTDNGMVRLGHVVVSYPVDGHSGAIQYSRGKAIQGRLERTGCLQPPPAALMSAAREVLVKRQRMDHDPIWQNVQRISTKNRHFRRFIYPTLAKDRLYKSDYEHRETDKNCLEGQCDPMELIEMSNDEEEEHYVTVHRGTIASADLVIKDAKLRDCLARQYGILCFETEAAGALIEFPCMVIRGISDYCDSHKNDDWHGFAAATAAAFARQLFLHLPFDEAALSTTALPIREDPHLCMDDTSGTETAQYNQNTISRVHQDFVTEKDDIAYLKCLKALAFEAMDDRCKNLEGTAAEGTCLWLQNHETYKRWSACDRGLLWIKGVPGSGKSTLLRQALRTVTEEVSKRRGDDLILSFFIHGRGSNLQRGSVGVIRSLLYQLGRHGAKLPKRLMASFKEQQEMFGNEGERWHWHERELMVYLELTLREALERCPIWIFIDALDESGEESAVALVESFESWLQLSSPQELQKLRICFTCRHYPILNLEGAYEISVEAENHADILNFVQRKLSSPKDTFSSDIQRLITQKANGVFMWAAWVVKQVLTATRQGAGSARLEAIIRSTPIALEAIYRQLLQEMRQESLKLMQWVIFALRPLRPIELRWAMLIDPDVERPSLSEYQTAGEYPSDQGGLCRRILTISCGLVEIVSVPQRYLTGGIRRVSEVVQVVHQSVKDFFFQEGFQYLSSMLYPLRSKELQFNAEEEAHFMASRVCIRYLQLMYPEQKDGVNRHNASRTFPFMIYVMWENAEHMRKSGNRGTQQPNLLDCMGWPSENYVKLYARLQATLFELSNAYPGSESSSMLHFFAWNSVSNLLRAALQRDECTVQRVNAIDHRLATPLSIAAMKGKEDIVRQLLKYGARPDNANQLGLTPLLRAAAEGHEIVVSQLLDAGAEVDTVDQEGCSPLSEAAKGGHGNVVRQLLDRGALVDHPDKEGHFPLLLAAKGGHENVVRQLLDRGAQADQPDKKGQTPLQLAARGGHEVVARQLLKKGAQVDIATYQGLTPLSWALMANRRSMAQVLLEHGAQVDVAGSNGLTPLSLAAGIPANETIFQWLLGHGKQTEVVDFYGRTPLSKAAQWDWQNAVPQLLQKGANIEATDEDGRTPLSWAAGNCKGKGKAMVEKLLEWGAQVDTVDNKGRTPLFWATCHDNRDVANVLLKWGAKLDTVNHEGQTSLSRAIRRRLKAPERCRQCSCHFPMYDQLLS